MTPSKYLLTPPDELHSYVAPKESHLTPVYPDFEPWRHKREDDEILLNFVAKGYYAPSKVNFESISARSSLQESLPKLSDQLGDQFSKILHIREQEINRISAKDNSNKLPLFSDLSGPGFLLPSRVTLTDHRRELWLQELSSPYASLAKLSKHIPHGLKRRQVLEKCYMRQIPLKRAMWLIKCCYSMEWKNRMTKARQSSDSSNDINAQLTKEWTDNFVFILEKLIFDMNQNDNDPVQLKRWRTEVGYFLKLLGNCYSLRLIDKMVFHHWLIEFGAKVENFEFLPLTLHIITVFWDDISQPTEKAQVSQSLFLMPKMAEMLLYKYYMVSHSKSMINDEKYIINDIKKNAKIKESILSILRILIGRIFQNKSLEAFIFPNSSWDLYKPILYEIANSFSSNPENASEIRKKLELISYRNESIMFNGTLDSEDTETESRNEQGLDKSDNDIVLLKTVDTDFTKKLNDNPVEFDWPAYVDRNMLHTSHIRQLFLWAIHPYQKSRYEANELVVKILLLKVNSVERFQEFVIEDIIWSMVFQLAKISEMDRNLLMCDRSLYRLLNILITYGILKVPTYIRKLISSGVLYVPESNDKFVHCDILINLKVSPLMKSQYNMVLKNVMEYNASYYEKHNYDQLLLQAEELKQKIMNEENLNNLSYSLSVKIVAADWYLTEICSGNLLLVDRTTIVKFFQIFCIHLDAFHHFYKWIEFIVYHQLLSDIGALEALIDILLCYGKLFSQYINDHILFTKTFIYIYMKALKEKDFGSYAVTSFMVFWKFFMKSFAYALKIDGELKSELSKVYDEEKSKLERITKNKSELLLVYNAINGDESKLSMGSFPETFQTSLRGFLNGKNNEKEKKRFRNNLLLLMTTKREYNKFMSIYLKRKDFTFSDLLLLISYKLLTLDQIQSILSVTFVLKLLAIKNVDNGLYFEYHKDQYIRSNFETILATCLLDLTQNYTLFLEILIKYGMHSKLSAVTNKIVIELLKKDRSTSTHVIYDILNFGVPRLHESDDATEEEMKPSELYSLMNFNNLWMLQAYTAYYVEDIMKEDLANQALHDYLFEVIEVTNVGCLRAHIFDKISNIPTIQTIAQIYEGDFFNDYLAEDGNQKGAVSMIVDIITSLSKRVNGDLTMSNSLFQSLKNNLSRFANMDEKSLEKSQSILNNYLKMFAIHQNFIFKCIASSIQEDDTKSTIKIIDEIYLLFEKITFDLKLKLILYEILSSLKSHCIYISTTRQEGNGPRFECPKRLLELPPFQISSFIKRAGDFEPIEEADIGIETLPVDSGKTANRWFLFNKKEGQYWNKLNIEPYYEINNFQSENASCFNNSCLNLSLFNAGFEKKNPK
ncbi:hypothetical protein HG535_0A07610 [Zygotorulaspora mrakii]|uniref:Mediator of RNA polymerase II transcription subunit 12 n=1 Tax=Zygotorulaspora mrakii TaxID=42260 RepID=A0A7H9AYG8_ZYGMR|nr:uncharacterized protein HG535_0A07610 [Zygotorulaspora mrakii]QLG70819.1 hypothetical protein HG535_0A07610 [Zygotorulaspora mrakii]